MTKHKQWVLYLLSSLSACPDVAILSFGPYSDETQTSLALIDDDGHIDIAAISILQ
jgi:hypothetical protein